MAANLHHARSGVTVRTATISDVYAIAARMREQDAAEARALNRCPKRALRASFRASLTPPRVAEIHGEPVAIWGVGGDILSDVGHPWLVTTPAVERVPVSFVRVGTDELARMLEVKPFLENYVAAQYRRAIAFLRFVGFVVEPPQPVGRTRALFCRFWIDRGSYGV